MNESSKLTFSVVVPVFNKGPHINRSVSSVLNQSFEDFELILVNDASTDNSLEEIEKFHDSRIRIFQRDLPGPGGYAARNLGIEKAKGEWIAFLDADDQWFPEHLWHMHELAKRFPDCQFLTCRWQIVEPDGSILIDEYSRKDESGIPHTISLLEYLTLCVEDEKPTCASVACIRNNEIAENLFPEGRAYRGGDLYAWRSHIARSKKMAHSPHVGAVYHRDSVNMVTRLAPSSTDLAKGIVNDFGPFVGPEEMRMLKKDCNRNLFREWLIHRLAGKKAFNLASNLYWNGDIFYCISRSAVSLVPAFGLRLLVKTKAALRHATTRLINVLK